MYLRLPPTGTTFRRRSSTATRESPTGCFPTRDLTGGRTPRPESAGAKWRRRSNRADVTTPPGMNCLVGKVVVITGAGRGLGRAYARHAASAGAVVVVNDIAADQAHQVANEIALAGGDAVAHASTVATWTDAKALVDRCLEQYGRID